jgi:hypothetical protein
MGNIRDEVRTVRTGEPSGMGRRAWDTSGMGFRRGATSGMGRRTGAPSGTGVGREVYNTSKMVGEAQEKRRGQIRKGGKEIGHLRVLGEGATSGIGRTRAIS